MAQLGDPNPVVGEGDIQQPEAMDPVGVAEEWRSWMQEPGNRNAIMQFGINLMQPMAYGQTAAGHFGQALGGAGEAVDRYQTAQLKEEEMQRKNIDTDSRLRQREGELNIKAGRLENEQKREETRRLAQQTTERGVTSKIALEDQRVQMLQKQIERFGATQDLKDQLEIAKANKANAEAALADARTSTTPFDSETKRMKVEQDIATQQRTHDIEWAKLAERARRGEIIEESSLRSLYVKEQANEAKRELYNSGYKRPEETYEQWRTRRGAGAPMGGAQRPAGAPAPAQAGASPQAPAATAAPAAAGTPVGAEKTYNQGTFVKVKPGPDNDQSTWQKKGQ